MRKVRAGQHSELGRTSSDYPQSNVVSPAPARAALYQRSENDSLRSYDQRYEYEPLGVLAGTSGLAYCKTLASCALQLRPMLPKAAA